jgi:hypothetical protein
MSMIYFLYSHPFYYCTQLLIVRVLAAAHHLYWVLLALGAAHAEEGVGAPELLPRFRLHGDALLADGVALIGDDVVARVEAREGEVAVGAALELARVDVNGLLLSPTAAHHRVKLNP